MNTANTIPITTHKDPHGRFTALLAGKNIDWRGKNELIIEMASDQGVTDLRFLIPEHGMRHADFSATSLGRHSTQSSTKADICTLQKKQAVCIKPAGCPTVVMRKKGSKKLVVGHCSRINLLDSCTQHVIHHMFRTVFNDGVKDIPVSIILSAEPKHLVFSKRHTKYREVNAVLWGKLAYLGIEEHPKGHLDLPRVIRQQVTACAKELDVEVTFDQTHCFPKGKWWVHPENGRNMVIIHST